MKRHKAAVDIDRLQEMVIDLWLLDETHDNVTFDVEHCWSCKAVDEISAGLERLRAEGDDLRRQMKEVGQDLIERAGRAQCSLLKSWKSYNYEGDVSE